MDSLPPDKLRSGGLANGPSARRHASTLGVIGDGTTTKEERLTTLTIIKDDKGYGMKVSGDNPVYVQSVKQGGAAGKAGLHSGDTIIKVNGVNVMNRTHTEVVDLIKAATQVVLTVQQNPLRERSGSNAAMQSPSLQRQHTLHTIHQSSRDMITAPQPVDHEKLRQFEYQRAHTLKLMLEKEQRFADSLRSKLAKVTDSVAEAKLQQDLVGAERRVHTLVTQLEQEGMEPPPLPSRNRRSGGPPLSPPPPLRFPSSPPPPLPPRQYLLHNQSGGGSSSSTSGRGSSSSPPFLHHDFHASQHVCGSPPGGTPQVHTHHRTKSSPDSLLSNSFAEASKRLIASESMSELAANHALAKRSRAGGIDWEVCEEDDSGGGGGGGSGRLGNSSRRPGSPSTPPGTPPPPYHRSSTSPPDPDDTYCHIPDEDSLIGGEMSSEADGSPTKSASNFLLASATTGQVQQPIMSMEDEDMSDQEMNQLEDHGPFKSLSKLWNRQAHLAVFLNYVISNSDPASLLFYLVTDLYKEGSAKEMKKWAYEIHSSFLVPGAPLRLNNVDENIAREIDDVLLKESDKEEILRKIFWKARQKAKEELNEQLADFQAKRTAGLGTLFGPKDAELEESVHDKAKENKIIESVLVPKIEPFIEDIERAIVDDRRFTTGAALGTVMAKVFGIKGTHFNSLLERCPTYVSKDKSLKARLTGKTRKVTTKGHHCVAHQYYLVTYCNHCQLIIWGIGPQGYRCTICALNIHRACVNSLDEYCPGPMIKKEKGNDRISRIMDRIRPENPRRKQSSLNLAQVERAKRLQEEAEPVDHDTGERGGGGGKNSGSATGPGGGSGTTGGAGRPDPVREGELSTQYHDHGSDHSNHLHDLSQHVPKTKQGGASINRSESYKERIHQKRQLRERRKTSDPNLSKTNNEVEVDAPELSYKSNSGSSSNSSLSTRSVESENNSVGDVLVGSGGPGANATSGSVGGLGGTNATWDSDMDAEPDPADWTASVPEEVSKLLSARERKRQEVINEIFYTEKSHVRGLKVLHHVFHRPMREQQVLPADQIQLLFSNLEEMLSLHGRMNQAMKAKRKEAAVVGAVGQILVDQFDGAHGETFKKAASTFCARQQIALEVLKERRKKDPKLNSFLNDAEMNPVCRRLQLKDIISKGWIRLTKYPLLFESLIKYTAEEDKEEAGRIQVAIERSKELLSHVDAAVKEAEDTHRLAEIQRRLDKTPFDKAEHPIAQEFKNLDLTKHQLIHEGSLLWRIGNRQKNVELHVLLLDDSIILLQKQDEKFVLKFYSPTLSPVIKVSSLLVRHNAVDKKALFLVNTSHNGAQIYDLVANSSSEKRKWFKHISEAAEAYKQREGRHRRPDPGSSTDLDASAEPPRDGEDGHSTGAGNETLSPPPSSRMNSTGGSGTSPAPSTGPSTPQPGSPPVKSGGGAAAESTPTRSASSAAPPTGGGGTTPTGTSPQHAQTDSSAQQQQDYPPHVATFTAESTLIDPTEVVVSTRDVHTAEPVLTPLERLRRKDETVRQALSEKQALVADILHVPREEFENIAELVAADNSVDKEPSELVLAAVNKAHELSLIVNEALRLSEEEAVAGSCGEAATGVSKIVRLPQVPAYKLQGLASSLTSHLTQLLNIMTERDEERERLRRELQRSREQLHAMHEKYDNGPSALSIDASTSTKCPVADQGNSEDNKSVLNESQEVVADDSNSQTTAPEIFADASSGAELDTSTITTTSSAEDDKN